MPLLNVLTRCLAFNVDAAGLLVSACRQAHDPKSGQHKRGPQCGHHPCHCASLLTPYISGETPSVSLYLCSFPNLSSDLLLLPLLLFFLPFAVVDATVLACLRHTSQVNFCRLLLISSSSSMLVCLRHTSQVNLCLLVLPFFRCCCCCCPPLLRD